MAYNRTRGTLAAGDIYINFSRLKGKENSHAWRTDFVDLQHQKELLYLTDSHAHPSGVVRQIEQNLRDDIRARTAYEAAVSPVAPAASATPPPLSQTSARGASASAQSTSEGSSGTTPAPPAFVPLYEQAEAIVRVARKEFCSPGEETPKLTGLEARALSIMDADDRTLYSLIRAACDSMVQRHLAGTKSGRAAWQILDKKYAAKDKSSTQVEMMTRFMNMRQAHDEDADTWAGRLIDLEAQATEQGVEFPSGWMVTMFAQGANAVYKDRVAAVVSDASAGTDFEDIVTSIKAWESLRFSGDTPQADQHTAMAGFQHHQQGKGKRQHNNKKASGNQNLKYAWCRDCGKFGHYQGSPCPNKGKPGIKAPTQAECEALSAKRRQMMAADGVGPGSNSNRQQNNRQQNNRDQSQPAAAPLADAPAEERSAMAMSSLYDDSEAITGHYEESFCFVLGSGKVSADSFMLDSGATHHYINDLSYFVDSKPAEGLFLQQAGKDHKLHIAKIGTAAIVTQLPGNNTCKVTLKDARYVPDLFCSLISAGALTDGGKSQIISDREENIHLRKWGGGTFLIAHKISSRLFHIPVIRQSSAFILSAAQDNHQLWHQRLGHRAFDAVDSTAKLVNGLNLHGTRPDDPCQGCELAKGQQKPFKPENGRITLPGWTVSCDFWGPHKYATPKGACWAVVMSDEGSGFIWVYIVAHKSAVPDCLRETLTFCKRYQHKLQVFRTDYEAVLRGVDMEQIYRAEQIQHQHSAPYTPQQNGAAERAIRTVVTSARAMMLHADVDKRLWGDAMQTAAYVLNRTWRKGRSATPFELFTGERPDVSNLRTFGCKAYVFLPKPLRESKMSANTKLMIFVGYPADAKAYRFWDPQAHKYFISTTAKFIERSANDIVSTSVGDELPALPVQPVHHHFIHIEPAAVGAPPVGVAPGHPGQPIAVDQQPEAAAAPPVANEGPFVAPPADPPAIDPAEQPIEPPIPPNDGERTRWPGWVVGTRPESVAQDNVHKDFRVVGAGPRAITVQDPTGARATRSGRGYAIGGLAFEYEGLDCYALFTASIMADDVVTPSSYAAIKNNRFAVQWQKSVDTEHAALEANGTYELVDLPPGRKAIDTKYVFTIKSDSANVVERFKCRVVARGFKQIAGVDYYDTFAPTASYAAIRLFFAIAAALGWEIQQIDAVSAFLNALLTEEIYALPPPGFPCNGKVWRLLKALYGLKQAGRAWFFTLLAALEEFGLVQSSADPCLLLTADRQLAVIMVVDDMLIASSDSTRSAALVAFLKARFDIKDMGEPTKFVGLEITRDRANKLITLYQRKYASDIVKRFNLQDAYGCLLPITQGTQLESFNETDKPADQHLYQRMLGSVMYLAQATRPDLAYACGLYGRYAVNPSIRYLEGLKRVLRYVKTTINTGLVLGAGIEPGEAVNGPLHDNHPLALRAFSDASHADCLDTSRSTCGVLVKVGNSAIFWRSVLQRSIAQSTCEAETVAAVLALAPAYAIHAILRDFGLSDNNPVLYCDSMAAILKATGQRERGRSKALRIREDTLRQDIADGTLRLHYVSTTQQLADALTKPTTKDSHARFRSAIGLI